MLPVASVDDEQHSFIKTYITNSMVVRACARLVSLEMTLPELFSVSNPTSFSSQLPPKDYV